MTRPTPVVRPESRLRVTLEYYGALGDPLLESYAQLSTGLGPPIDVTSNNCHIHQCQVTDTVTDSRDPEQSAFWLDDDLPHVRRWAEDR